MQSFHHGWVDLRVLNPLKMVSLEELCDLDMVVADELQQSVVPVGNVLFSLQKGVDHSVRLFVGVAVQVHQCVLQKTPLFVQQLVPLHLGAVLARDIVGRVVVRLVVDDLVSTVVAQHLLGGLVLFRDLDVG